MGQKPAETRAEQGDIGAHGAFVGQGLSLGPQSLCSADPPLENQLTVG